MTDVTIFYQGGSGGFALYYYLLLSGNYQIDTSTAWKMINDQYNPELLEYPEKWKSKEIWPDNNLLKQSSGPNLFLICNPLFPAERLFNQYKYVSNNTYKILLYTNIHLQLRMAWEKKAWWFTKISKQFFKAPSINKQYIRWILNSAIEFNNKLVDKNVPLIIDKFQPDQIVQLNEFVLTKNLLNFPAPNQDQLDFLQYWHSIQPSKAKKLIT